MTAPRTLSALALAVVVVVHAALSLPACAAEAPATLASAARPAERQVMNRASNEYRDLRRMSSDHPNEVARLDAVEAYGQGRMPQALARFRAAASYGDKYSQHRLALMYWYGDGTAPDPVLAYIWADLAAERDYPALLAVRDEIWGRLDSDERARALRDGAEYYARYGDDVARPRMARQLRIGRSHITGSHAGIDYGVEVTVPADGPMIDDALRVGRGMNTYWADYRWKPSLYWANEDAVFGKGSVRALPLTPIHEPTPDPSRNL